MKNLLTNFEDYKIRQIYDEKTETWHFSVVDIIQALLQQPDFQTARKYWNKRAPKQKRAENFPPINSPHLASHIGPNT